jgi:hypothetical protein
MCRSLMPMISAACHHGIRFAIARKITSCTFIARSRFGHSMVRPGYRLNDGDDTLLPNIRATWVTGKAANTRSIFYDGPQGLETANGCPVLRRQEPPPRGTGASCGFWQVRHARSSEARVRRTVPVRIVDRGDDVTGPSSFPTDNDGFYQIETTHRIRRTAKLIVACPQGMVELSLNRHNQVKAKRQDLDPSAIFFHHSLQCEVRK